jgi:anionic cell wall polymer biosynthesis LytR-Cps2A-Psr (LCP) family protein
MGYEPDCWAIVDLEAFEKLVDAIGGVYYDVPVDMYYNDPDQDLYINISAGYQWLSGADALKVVRFRSGYANADIGRIGTQQDFLKTVASQMLTLGNIPNLTNVYDIYEEYVDTNLTVGNIAWFVKEFLKLDEEDITFDIVPGNYTLTVGRLSYVSVDVDAWLELVNTTLSPLDKEITRDDVNILTYDTTYGASSTTGVVAGGENSFY